MFHFGFSKESRAQACLSTEQRKRVHHIRASHQCMKDLNAALSEATRCHDRYVESLDKVVNLLALHSDTFEDARKELGECGAAIAPTHAAAKLLCDAFNAWRVSAELGALRRELDDLRQLTDSLRKTTKRDKTEAEEMEKYAIRCAEVNSTAYNDKIAQRSGEAREKLVSEQQRLNAKFAMLDAAVLKDLQSTGSWWSVKVVAHCEELYRCFAGLGQRTVALFPQMQPAVTGSQPPCSSWSCSPPQQQDPQWQPQPPAASASPQGIDTQAAPQALYAGYADSVPTATAPPPTAASSTMNGGYGAQNTAVGVPLEFQTSRTNVEGSKTVD